MYRIECRGSEEEEKRRRVLWRGEARRWPDRAVSLATAVAVSVLDERVRVWEVLCVCVEKKRSAQLESPRLNAPPGPPIRPLSPLMRALLLRTENRSSTHSPHPILGIRHPPSTIHHPPQHYRRWTTDCNHES